MVAANFVHKLWNFNSKFFQISSNVFHFWTLWTEEKSSTFPKFPSLLVSRTSPQFFWKNRLPQTFRHEDPQASNSLKWSNLCKSLAQQLRNLQEHWPSKTVSWLLNVCWESRTDRRRTAKRIRQKNEVRTRSDCFYWLSLMKLNEELRIYANVSELAFCLKRVSFGLNAGLQR